MSTERDALFQGVEGAGGPSQAAGEDMSASEMSDKNPAGRVPYAPESEHNSPSSAGRDRAEGCAEDPALSAEQHHDSQVNTGRGAAQRAGSAGAPVDLLGPLRELAAGKGG